MSVASELVDRLRRHYIKDAAQPGGVFLAECGLNNGFGNQSRVDALHVGFTGTSGRILRGHEIKVSRADWLHELDQPDKATVWHDACHEWWLVTPTTDLVRTGELPPGWGHMVPDPRAKTRFRIVERAARKPDDHSPSWLVMRSVLARIDTITRTTLAEERATLREQMHAEMADRLAQARQQAIISYEDQAKIKAFDELAASLGADPDQWIDRRTIADAARLAPHLTPLLASRYGQGQLGQLAAQLAPLIGLLTAAETELCELIGRSDR